MHGIVADKGGASLAALLRHVHPQTQEASQEISLPVLLESRPQLRRGAFGDAEDLAAPVRTHPLGTVEGNHYDLEEPAEVLGPACDGTSRHVYDGWFI
jgi:hypothetical protein